MDDSNEFSFAKKAIRILHDILLISDFIEQFVVIHEMVDDKERYYSPKLAIFYWSKEILEAIQSFKHKKKFIVECSIGGFAGTFPRLRAKYENDVDTINRCIVKLYNKYLNSCHW